MYTSLQKSTIPSLSTFHCQTLLHTHTHTHTEKKKKKDKKTHYRKKSRNTILTILRNNTTTNLLWSSIERQNCLSTVLPWGVNVLSPSNSRQSRSQPLPQRVGWRCVTRRKRRTPVAGARAAGGHFKASQSIRFEVDPITFANGAPPLSAVVELPTRQTRSGYVCRGSTTRNHEIHISSKRLKLTTRL